LPPFAYRFQLLRVTYDRIDSVASTLPAASFPPTGVVSSSMTISLGARIGGPPDPVAGLDVELFANAEEFLVASEHRRAHCLILESTLPGLSGLELQDG